MARLTKIQLKKIELAEITRRNAELFDQDMKELLQHILLEPATVQKWDIQMIWDDVKESVGYIDIEGPGKFGRGLKTTEWNNPQAAFNTESLIRKHLKEASELYPIELTSHLLKWYSIFKPAVLDLPCYEPSEEDYQHYFMLRGNGTKIEKLEELVGGRILFYVFIHRLYTQQGQRKRAQVIRYMLSDPEVVEQLRKNTYVVPANLQFLLTTPQIYNAFGKCLVEGKELPLPTPREEIQKAQDKRQRELRTLFNQVIQLQKEGKEVVFTHDKSLPHNPKR